MNHIDTTVFRYQADQKATFFGYFDKSPYSIDNKKILACATSLHKGPPKEDDVLTVGFFDIGGDVFHEIGQTTSWCWQQGCMLQWHPSDASVAIFNKNIRGSHRAVAVDISSGTAIAEYARPVYAISSTYSHSISLNFARLHRLRPGYGYADAPRSQYQLAEAPQDDGLWLQDMTTGGSILLFSVAEIAKISPQSSMSGAYHYLNHASFSPSGRRCVFFHLWTKDGRRRVRAFTYDLVTEELRLITRGEMISHFTWQSDDSLIAYAHHPTQGNRFYVLAASGVSEDPKVIAALSEDGHPSVSPSGGLLLCDTYPDRFGEQQLLVVFPSGRSECIARLKTAIRLVGETRCDLHPRWDRSGKLICVDSACDGTRAMYSFSLPREVRDGN